MEKKCNSKIVVPFPLYQLNLGKYELYEIRNIGQDAELTYAKGAKRHIRI